MIWPDPIGLGLAAALNVASPMDAGHIAAAKQGVIGAIAEAARPTFRPRLREVSTWRIEALLGLEHPVDVARRLAKSPGEEAVPRCVRLNNYWCIKKAGWIGEIAADNEGHVAFATAREGAMIAARLLRRYYVDFGRHDAQAIVEHWAPPQCNLVALHGAPKAEAPKLQASKPQAPKPDTPKPAPLPPARPVAKSAPEPAQPPSPQPAPQSVLQVADVGARTLARFGLGKTLRARWLATHNRGGTLRLAHHNAPAAPTTGKASSAGKAKPRLVAVARQAISKSVPAVEAGEKDISLSPLKVALLSTADLSQLGPAQPAACSSDAVRIHNYAVRAIEGIAHRTDEDLKLFNADGTPGPNLLPFMLNMAKVEIGPLAVREDLAASAIAAVFPSKGEAKLSASKLTP